MSATLATNVIYHSEALKEPAAAIVTRVNADGTVNLSVFRDGSGRTFSVFNVAPFGALSATGHYYTLPEK